MKNINYSKNLKIYKGKIKPRKLFILPWAIIIIIYKSADQCPTTEFGPYIGLDSIPATFVQDKLTGYTLDVFLHHTFYSFYPWVVYSSVFWIT